MNKSSFVLLLLLTVAAVAFVAGCVPMGVEVWERDVLAQPEMQLNYQTVDRALDEHIYFSKEGSSGGRGFAGGGCGCN